ncbi:MAG: hypothetical protein CVU79_08825 [Elusimicrobia bacterium HGW-Elusimicrobia-3]|jgi:hypothetical protein|nr:MAG: hypothetical protein CVU79_08825 [Elusimicrobia bacterium HGW-Elusimicrobia-3]
MKKANMLAVAAAVLMAAGAASAQGLKVDFDGSNSAAVSGLGLAAAIKADKDLLPAQADLIPARVYTPAESVPLTLALKRLPRMDKTILSAIKYTETHKMARAKASFECLLKTGTPQQKFAYVYGDRTVPYKFPETCAAKPELQKDIIDDFLHWVCRTYTEFVVQYNCHPTDDGDEKCDEELVELITESCNWE